MVHGHCVYHVAHQGLLRIPAQQTGQNVEMTNYTQALYDARELAMARMQAEAEACRPRASWACRLTSEPRLGLAT